VAEALLGSGPGRGKVASRLGAVRGAQGRGLVPWELLGRRVPGSSWRRAAGLRWRAGNAGARRRLGCAGSASEALASGCRMAHAARRCLARVAAGRGKRGGGERTGERREKEAWRRLSAKGQGALGLARRSGCLCIGL
jgi:hypothetical protein